jgi:ribosome assembly protein 1
LESGENSVPTTAYVTKMQPFDAKLYDITTRALQKSAGKTRMIAICRVFSGILRVGQKVFVMGPKHQLNGQQDVKETIIEHLFLLMGSSLKLVDEVPAGSIVGIGGLDDILIKTGTLSSTPSCPNFVRLQTISMGLVKVVLNSQEIGQMEILKEGLIKLNRSDPSVQFFINKGQYILSTCGEIHLERCMKDLNDEFCPGVEIQVSDPIIPFRETILNKALTNRILKNKKENFEEIDEESDSDGEEKKAVEEMCVAELIAYE